MRFAPLIMTVLIGTLAADITDDSFSADDLSTYDLSPTPDEGRAGPLTVRFSTDVVGGADFKRRIYTGQDLEFREWDVDGSYIFYYNPCRKEGLGLELGYSRYHLGWAKNPFFKQEDFNVMSFGVSFFSARAWRWDWKGFAKINMNTDHWDIGNWATYDFMVWGRFELTTDIGIHTGFLALTGMKIDRVYPIIGFDYAPNMCWKISAVFPTNFSIIYTPNCNWTFLLASRFWDVRQRADNDEPLRKAVWEYRNSGAELGVTYKYSRFIANAHVGYAFGGQLKIWDRHKTHAEKNDLEGAPYVGGEAALNF